MPKKDRIIREAWTRSERYGINPKDRVEDVLEHTRLHELLEEKSDLLRVAVPTAERLSGWAHTRHSTIILSHENGYILSSIGDPQFITDAEKIHLKEGAGWSEQSRGTNAVGTAAAVREPVAVVGNEHFLLANRFLYCAAAPIYDPSGRMTAVVDISGYCREYHPSSLHLADFLSRQVENELVLRSGEASVVLELRPMKGAGCQALLALHEDGFLVGANRDGRHLFEHTDGTKPGNADIIVKTVIDLMPSRSSKSFYKSNVRLEIPGYPTDRWTLSVLVDRRPIRIALGKNASGKGPSAELRYTFADIFCRDPELSATLHAASKVAETDFPVLIVGESGTGKEMVGQAIHSASARRHGPFVAINCGAISPTLLHSELFGYEPGAFTGADRVRRLGKIELAHGGTLFLDEVAEMPQEMQVALLRVLQEQVITRVGGTQSIPVDVRIIAATNEDLWERVQEGRFRSDLYFRLLGVELKLPPIRKRQDSLELATFVLDQISREQGRPGLRMGADVVEFVKNYSWPGNVREMNAIFRQACFFVEGAEIHLEHLPSYALKRYRHDRAGREPSKDPIRSLKQLEHAVIMEVLKSTDGNVTQAARLLGIGRNTLYRRLRKFAEQPGAGGT